MTRLVFAALLACGIAASAAGSAGAVPPTDIATGTAEPSDTSARVVGYWNYGSTSPPGIPDSCWFDYGTTLAYGSRTSAVCSGTSYATLTPLVPGTTYHYRAAGSNADGTTYGPDKTFTTLGSPPAPGTPAPPATPGATLDVGSGRSLGTVLRRGLQLQVTLSGACPCVVRARLVVSRATAKRLRTGTRSIATIRREVDLADRIALTLKPKRAVRRKLRRARTLRVTARVSVSRASGGPVVVSRSLRLRRASG
jgi:hypothetical protein